MSIGVIGQDEVDAVRALVAERLDDVAGLDACLQRRPSALIVARQDGRPVGACFAGREDDDGREITLQGIAVEPAVARRGIGSRLLGGFEQAVSSLGFGRIGVGSAPGYPELFYERNGYLPVEYLVTVPDPPPRLDGLPVRRVRRGPGCTLVNIASTKGRDPAAQAAVLAACGGTDLVIIYAKDLRSR